MARFESLCIWMLRVVILTGGIFQPGAVYSDESRGNPAGTVFSEFNKNTHVIHVGPNEAIRSIAKAAMIARDGDTIEIDPGEYRADVAIWTQDKLKVRGIGGRVRLNAFGASAEQKAIWVVRGGSMIVENIDFVGTRVPDHNGAGIRFEKGNLLVRNCLFENNENGILTGGDKNSELRIEDSEFGHNGAGDGQSHNLYVGSIRKLTVTGSYFHHARVGHLLKSRARENEITYNRLTDEMGGQASYELEFPSGGVAYVIGNVIQQGSQTENPNVISFGAEGYAWPQNELYLVNNTLVDDRPHGGNFLRVKAGATRIVGVNNLLVGTSRLESAGIGEYKNNFNTDWSSFALAVRQDYRLTAHSDLVGKAIEPGAINGVNLKPDHEYLHPRQSKLVDTTRYSPGAIQTVVP